MIEFFKNRYNVEVGFSDHSIGYESSLGAISLGAKIIEKHFTLDRNYWGADHKTSLLPEEFEVLVKKIRRKEIANINNFGRLAKFLNNDEAVFRPIFRKSLVASMDLKKGEIISPEKIYAMRPQAKIDGLSSENYEKILGKTLKIDLKKYKSWEINSGGLPYWGLEKSLLI